MPPRISRSSLPKAARPSKPQSGGGRRAPKKSAKRALNAFAIASHDAPDRTKIRKGRLGESDVDARKKRPREEDEEDEEEEEDGVDVKRRKQTKGGNDSYDEGSDSEGNNWKMGHVDDDNDSDIDSDEAFGESDEERFEGWTFRGSQSNQRGGKPKKQVRHMDMEDGDEDIDLDEEDSGDEEEDEDDLGEDAIDLATALDQYEESEEEEKKSAKKSKKKKVSFDDSDESPSEADDIAADGASDFSSSGDEDEGDEEDRRAQLNDLISSLAAEEEQKSAVRRAEVHESSAPSEFGISRKVDLSAFKSKTADPERKKALKLLQDDNPSTKRNDMSRKLDAPLPKRQQDKLDRAAANAKAEETLERWVDTVKRNRQAEHLSFPLNQGGEGPRMGETRLLATTTSAPTNELESTIQSILQQSGLSNGHEDEDKIQKWETLQTNKLPLEEVMKRRAQLRKERELLFREEVRAKRVKKIKSKAYRRVHRKERERLLERERDALKADGVDISEDEREYNDRRRAEERMGAKHRDSKWAKGVKASGKAAWDEDARSGVTEMARRNEELRRRMEGKAVRDEDEDDSDLSSEDEDEDMDDEDDDDNEVLQRQLGRLKENPFSTKESKLGSMAFMQKAENARRAQNDEDIERIRKELAGEESNSEDEDETSTRAGRRKFGPESNTLTPAIQIRKSEFEEREGSDAEAEDEDNDGTKSTTRNEQQSSNASSFQKSKPANKKTNKTISSAAPRTSDDETPSHQQGNPYLVKAKKDKKSTSSLPSNLTTTTTTTTTTTKPQPSSSKKPSASSKKQQPSTQQQADHGLAGNPTLSAPDDDGFQTVSYNNHDDDNDDSDNDSALSNEGIDLDSAVVAAMARNNALTASAFASDAAAVEAEFAAEKAENDDWDDDQHGNATQQTMPGWGSWAGVPDSKNSKNKKRKSETTYQKKEEAQLQQSTNGKNKRKRKGQDNDRVILTQRRTKANTRYLAPQLPFPFESKEQYERGLRMPLGSEWTTKQTHQKATLPRVLVKQGVIGALRKPLV
ncbi:Utp14-domain-containing protein [Periconia macrospinosa]|uniref:Utp14-domain-containing protein n=1 Tax=Periconia macrospinosa TaxID=97972 RepID=A0A2V1E3M1_9PLEO|nr:Utp14-domain-containing protein [Periconia macrospinosa]